MGAPKEPRLSLRQRRFVEAYTGEAQGVGSEAARIAGFKGVHKQVAFKLMHMPHVRAAIDEICLQDGLVASREQRRAWLVKVISGEIEGETRDRVRAMELLQKSSGDFVTQVQVTGAITHQAQAPLRLDALNAEELRSYRSLMLQAEQIVERAEARVSAAKQLPSGEVIDVSFEVDTDAA